VAGLATVAKDISVFACTTLCHKTLALTTFALFQFFNAFNVRVERGTAYNKHFFNNKMHWTALTSALIFQVISVQWMPAQAVFGTRSLSLADWVLASVVA
jgi:Ca2+-transporting ATPase